MIGGGEIVFQFLIFCYPHLGKMFDEYSGWGWNHHLPSLKLTLAPENWWLEDSFPFGMTYFQVLC